MPAPAPFPSPSAKEASPLLQMGRWAWYSLPVASLLAGLALWSATQAPSEEATRALHETNALEWHYITSLTGS